MFAKGTDGLLSGAMDLLDTPRQAVYQGLIDPAFHALGGDPDAHIGRFADLLGQAGMDPDSYLTQGLGVLGDVATDPLTYAGALGGLKGAKALRGMIPFDAAQDAGRAAKGATSLAEGSQFRAPLSKVPEFRDVGFASPERLAQAGIKGGVVARAGAEEGIGRQVVAVGAPNAVGEGFTGFVARGRDLPDQAIQTRATWLSGLGSDGIEGSAGFYDPTSQTLATRSGLDPARAALTARHERVHAVIDQAARSADSSVAAGLPAVMRYPAQLMQGDSAFSRTAGRIGDELAAHALQHRGLGDQLVSAAGFLFNPEKNAAYAQRFGFPSQNPSMAAVNLYRSLPTAFLGSGAAGGGAAGGGSGLLARSL